MDGNLKSFLDKRRVSIEKIKELIKKNGDLIKEITPRNYSDDADLANVISNIRDTNFVNQNLKRLANERYKTVIILEATDGKCPFCGKELSEEEIDLVKELNLPCCKSCGAKRDKKRYPTISAFLDKIIADKGISYKPLFS